MTEKQEDRLVKIVHAAGGRLVSRIRLQKIAYLLDQVEKRSEFDYSYHHYGPYARDLDNAILDAEAFGKLEENIQFRKSDGARYSVFELTPEGRNSISSPDEGMKDLVSTFTATNITVLELAATAHWLATAERVEDWEEEIRRRKGTKTENGRLEEAKALLGRIGLPPVAQAI